MLPYNSALLNATRLEKSKHYCEYQDLQGKDLLQNAALVALHQLQQVS